MDGTYDNVRCHLSAMQWISETRFHPHRRGPQAHRYYPSWVSPPSAIPTCGRTRNAA